MSAGGVDVDGVKRLAGRHEKAVVLASSEAKVAAGFGQFDQTDALTFGIENVDAIVAVADPSCAGPEVSIDVAANAI